MWLEAEGRQGIAGWATVFFSPIVGPAPKEPCLSRWVEVTLSTLLCTRLDVLSEWTRMYAQVFS